MHIIIRGLRFYTRKSDCRFLTDGQSLRESTKMKKLLYLTACVGLVVAMSGCSSNSCGTSGFSCFKDRPLRARCHSWFGGDRCDTCCPPAGQPNCDSNVAPLCDSCGVSTPHAGNVSLYSEPGLNAPITNQPIQNPSPDFSGSATQGGADAGVQPPNF